MAYTTEWDLTQLLGGRTPEQLLAEIEKHAEKLASYREKLSPEMSEELFLEIVESNRVITELRSRLGAFARMQVDTDTASDAKRALLSNIRAAGSRVSNKIRFISQWWKKLDDENAARLAKTLGDDAYVFEHSRSLQKHTLAEEEENIISLKDTTGSSALITLHGIVSSRMSYPFEGKDLTVEEVRSMFADPSHEKRKSSYGVFFSVKKKERDVIGEIYKNIVLDWENERELRDYDSAISVRNKVNDLPDEVVQAHLDACRESAPIWQRFFKLKEKLLGIKMTRYDVYAPLETVEKEYTYDEAVELTLDSLGEFSPNLRVAAEEMYNGKFIHVLPAKGKRSGAYCWGVTPQLPAFMLYNFTGKLRDVSTVAHETGHGIHHHLGRKHTIFSFGHALPIAETASIFSEILLSAHLQKQDPSVKKALLVGQLNDMYATIARQSFFVLFEIEAHKLLVSGKPVDDVSKAFRENLQEQFGDVFEVPEEFADEWLSIPHFFHTPFYCYAYSFGNLLTLALYAKYLEEGESFVAKYEEFLAAAETRNPIDICKIVGVDVSKKSFWEQGFKIIEQMIDELEKLA